LSMNRDIYAHVFTLLFNIEIEIVHKKHYRYLYGKVELFLELLTELFNLNLLKQSTNESLLMRW